MQFTSVVLGAVFTALAACTPFPTVKLDIVSLASNCTDYYSEAAGHVCIVRPYDCTATYLVQPDDNCNSISEFYGNFTTSQLYYWNPDIGTSCFGLQAYVPVCINTPWYHFTPPVQAAYGTIEGPDSLPIPLMPNIVSTCTNFIYFGADMSISQVTRANGITVEEFSLWNGNVTSVWAEYWVCVKA